MTEETNTAQLMYKGQLKGHSGTVTCIASTSANPNLIVTGSRDKSIITWELTKEQGNYGFAKKSMLGHNHFVNDISISSDGLFVLSGSWDKTLKLWDIQTGKSMRTFNGHTKDVLSVAFSADNRQIVSAGRDKTIKLWNTLGECKFTFSEGQHTDWVSCVRFSPKVAKPVIVSAGWDKKVKVWDLSTYKNSANLIGHTGPINTVTVSPDGSLCASAGKDGTAMLWDLNKSEHLYSLTANESINALCFSPNRYWLCAATDQSIKIWDLETKKIVAELVPEYSNEKTKKKALCVSLAWSSDGSTLFSGYTDGKVRVWGVV